MLAGVHAHNIGRRLVAMLAQVRLAARSAVVNLAAAMSPRVHVYPYATCYETKKIKRTPGARGGIAACSAKAPTFAPGSLLFKT